MVWRQESEESFGEALERWVGCGAFTYCPVGDLTAPIASGTFPTAGMVVTPCSMASVAAMSSGMTDNLLRRAADVTLKERRPLVIVPRETPLTETHLENMARLARRGVVVLPPHPPFYLGDGSIQHTVDFIVERTMVALGLTDRMPEGMTYREPRTLRLNLRLRPPTIPPTHKPSQRYTKRNPVTYEHRGNHVRPEQRFAPGLGPCRGVSNGGRRKEKVRSP